MMLTITRPSSSENSDAPMNHSIVLKPTRPSATEAQTNAGARQEAQAADLKEGLDATVRPDTSPLATRP